MNFVVKLFAVFGVTGGKLLPGPFQLLVCLLWKELSWIGCSLSVPDWSGQKYSYVPPSSFTFGLVRLSFLHEPEQHLRSSENCDALNRSFSVSAERKCKMARAWRRVEELNNTMTGHILKTRQNFTMKVWRHLLIGLCNSRKCPARMTFFISLHLFSPESVEASPAVNEKNLNTHSCGSAQSHGYRGLPYTVSS